VTAELHLIGTLPRDPSGPQRLRDLLGVLRPDVVAVQGSRVDYERARATSHPALEDATEDVLTTPGHSAATANLILRLLSPRFAHFEHDAAVRYTNRHKRRLVFLDEDASEDEDAEPGVVQDPLVPSIPALANVTLTTADLLALAARDWNAEFARAYDRGRAALSAGTLLEGVLPSEHRTAHTQRAAALSAAVTRLLRDAPIERIAVVCSVSHLYASDASLTLFSVLRHEPTARYLLEGGLARA
jgi:hypothetical protein